MFVYLWENFAKIRLSRGYNWYVMIRSKYWAVLMCADVGSLKERTYRKMASAGPIHSRYRLLVTRCWLSEGGRNSDNGLIRRFMRFWIGWLNIVTFVMFSFRSDQNGGTPARAPYNFVSANSSLLILEFALIILLFLPRFGLFESLNRIHWFIIRQFRVYLIDKTVDVTFMQMTEYMFQWIMMMVCNRLVLWSTTWD